MFFFFFFKKWIIEGNRRKLIRIKPLSRFIVELYYLKIVQCVSLKGKKRKYEKKQKQKETEERAKERKKSRKKRKGERKSTKKNLLLRPHVYILSLILNLQRRLRARSIDRDKRDSFPTKERERKKKKGEEKKD